MPEPGNNVVAVIPARYASQRFPGKPLALIAGIPMIVRVLHNVQQAARVDRVVVATDDERIAEVVVGAGGEVAMTSPDLPSGSDRVWAAAQGLTHSIVVNVQGDEPLLPGSVVDALVARLDDDPTYDIATPVIRVRAETATGPDVVAVARDDAGSALYFSRSLIPHGSETVWQHVGVYAYRRAALERFVAAPRTNLEISESLEQLRALSLGLRFAAVPVELRAHAVDRLEDVAAVERLLNDPNRRPSFSDIRMVVLDVDGVLTEGRVSYLGEHEQLLSFDIKDGYGITALRAAGIDVAIISGRDSTALRRRAAELGIEDLRLAVTDKESELRQLAASKGVRLDEVCYVGDDHPDFSPMAIAGLSAAPCDADPLVFARATIRLRRPGGRGAVRELADLLLAVRAARP
jgi:3-deoxy-D-manno-octulosonate 8-phosphate phosphatase (KDO 8-P phosphatase)